MPKLLIISSVDMFHSLAHWAEPNYGLSAGQHAVLPKGKAMFHRWPFVVQYSLPV